MHDELNTPPFGQHPVWSYGTGNPGVGDGELSGPHAAEENPFNPDEIVVAEQYGNDILIISRSSREMRVLFGERGVAGSGRRLSAAHSAHFMPSGPYQEHLLITEYQGEHRVMILHRDSGEILWCHTGLEAPLEAIPWDDDHIMASDRDHGVFKIRMSDGARLWRFDPQPHRNPFYLHKLNPQFCDSYGGDLLVGYYGPDPVVREVDTRKSETVWLYGERHQQGSGDLYDRLSCPVRALRYGINEHGGGLTIIADERARILCVNEDKELVWELGGASPRRLLTATPHMVSPTYVHLSRRGTLLVTDWGRNMIYEVNPFSIPPRTEKDAYLFHDYATTDQCADSGIMEARGYRGINIQVSNAVESGSLQWQLLGSADARDWQIIHEPEAWLGPGQSTHLMVDRPWNFIMARAKSAMDGKPARTDVHITMRR